MAAYPALQHATELARLIGRVQRLNRSRISKALNGVKQSLLDWQVIANVKWQGPMTQGALAGHVGTQASSMSRTIDSLQRRGMIRRVVDREDRRCITVHLTAKGAAWYERWHRLVMGELHANMSKLSAREQGQLEALLLKLLAA